MTRRLPVIFTKYVNVLRDICDSQISADDGLELREFAETSVDFATAICAKQDIVFNHQASVLYRRRGCATDKRFALDELFASDARNFSEVLQTRSGVLQSIFKY